MENATIAGTLKQVGNSLCLFIPADIKADLHLKAQEEVIAEIRKKKDKTNLLSLAGATKGKLGPWSELEDRLDVRE